MFKRVDHVIIAVSDFEAGVDLYGQKLGLRGAPADTVPHLGAKRCRFNVGNAFIDVVTPSTPDSPLHAFIKDRGEGIYLIAVQVDDLASTVAQLERKGAEIIREGGRVMVSPKTTHGALMQLIS